MYIKDYSAPKTVSLSLGTVAAYIAPNTEEHYRAEYFALTDTAITQLDTRFNPQSRSLAR